MSTRKLPVRTKKIELTDDWVGWEFTARVNPKMKTFSKITSGEFDQIIAGLSELVTDWNFVDEEGNPMGHPSDLESMAEIPNDLAKVLVEEIVLAITTMEKN